MPEERLAVVLGGSQVAAASAHRVTRRQRGVGLFYELCGKRRPLLVPAVAVTRRDLGCDVQALADIGHPRIALSNSTLQLAVEVLLIEVQLHNAPEVRGFTARGRVAG